MPVEGVNVIKIVEPKLLGMYKEKEVYLMYGMYGYYIKHDGKNYSLPSWSLGKDTGILEAIKTIEYKNNKPPQPMPSHLKHIHTYKNSFETEDDILSSEAA